MYRLDASCPSCHLTNNIRALEWTWSIDPNWEKSCTGRDKMTFDSCKKVCHASSTPPETDFIVNLPTCQLAGTKGQLADKTTHTLQQQMQTFTVFHIECQTCAVDVVGKGLQVVVSRSDDKCVNQFIGELTSLSASWLFHKLTCYPQVGHVGVVLASFVA